MAEKTEKKPSSIQRLFEFAGNYKYLAVASWYPYSFCWQGDKILR